MYRDCDTVQRIGGTATSDMMNTTAEASFIEFAELYNLFIHVNMRILKTLRVTGTKTPANVPSLPVPPTGLGKAPGRGFAASEGRLPSVAFGDFDLEALNLFENHSRIASMPWSLSWCVSSCAPTSRERVRSSFELRTTPAWENARSAHAPRFPALFSIAYRNEKKDGLLLKGENIAKPAVVRCEDYS